MLLACAVRCFTTFWGAQTPVCRHVPASGLPVWQLAGSMDAVAGRLRPESEQNKRVMARVARIVPVKPIEEVRA